MGSIPGSPGSPSGPIAGDGGSRFPFGWDVEDDDLDGDTDGGGEFTRWLDPEDRDEGYDGAAPLGEQSALFRVRPSAFVTVVILGLCQGALLVAFLLLLRGVLESMVPRGVGRSWDLAYAVNLQRCLWLVAISAVLGFLRAWEFSVAERAGYHVVRDLRMAMFARLQRMLPEHLLHRARGGLLLRLTGDLSMLRMWLSRGLLLGTSALITLLCGLGLALWFNPVMGTAMVTCLGLGAVLSLASGHAMRRATRIMRRRRSLLIGNIDEQINALAVTQAAGRESGEYARLSRQNDSLTTALITVARLRGRLRGIAVFSGLLSTAVVATVGVVQARGGWVTLDVVVLEILIVRFLTRPVRMLGLSHDYWHRGQVSREKVVDFLKSSARPEPDQSLEKLRVRRPEIVFDNVAVAGSLHPLTATAGAGRIIGLTGGPGSGAATVLALVARLVEPTAGEVWVSGQALSQVRPSSSARSVGIVSPDLPLLRGTLRRNLTYFAPDADAAEVQRVLLALGLDDLMGRLDDEGVLAWILEGGRNLAVNDRQLVLIARALIGNPPIVLLDQPLDGLDDAAKVRGREALLRHRGTIFWHTHDPAELGLADEVWTFADGSLVDIVSGEDHRRRSYARRGEANTWRAQPLGKGTDV